jgi:dTDP-4-dehydrorhamnose reductase
MIGVTRSGGRTGVSGSVLLVGGDSEIGGVAAQHLRGLGVSPVVTTRRRQGAESSRPFLDLAQPLTEWRPPVTTSAACILAGVTRLLACERDPKTSSFINVIQTTALAEKLLERGISVLFLSTDKVFDGSRAHVPVDAPVCPTSEYGRQKACVEAALEKHMRAEAPVAILRLAKVVSPGMPLLRQWVTALSAGEPVRAFFDMNMAPTPVALVACAIAGLLQQRERARGIFHLTGPRDVSYAEVAVHLARKIGADARLVTPVSALSTGMAKGSTAAHTTLDSSAIRERLGIIVPDPWTVIDDAGKIALTAG